MRKITLALFAVLSLWIAKAEPASAQIVGGIVCEQLCSLSTDSDTQACCSQGLNPCDTAQFNECLEDRQVASGQICAQIDDFQSAHQDAIKNGEETAIAETAQEEFCCAKGYFPGTASYDCCLKSPKRLVGRLCPQDPPTSEPTPEEPQTLPTEPVSPAPEDPAAPSSPPAPEPIEPTAPVVEAPAPAIEEGVFTCEVARDEDVGPSGKIIAVSSNGLVPFLIRYNHPNASSALNVELRQSEGLPVAITDLSAGSESIAGKSLVSALSSGGEVQWVVYLSRPTSLVGDWNPDASFEVTVRDALNADEIARFGTACLAAAHVQGGQGGCVLDSGASRGGKALEFGLTVLAVVALAIFRSRKGASVC
jgi:hypothetical protein